MIHRDLFVQINSHGASAGGDHIHLQILISEIRKKTHVDAHIDFNDTHTDVYGVKRVCVCACVCVRVSTQCNLFTKVNAHGASDGGKHVHSQILISEIQKETHVDAHIDFYDTHTDVYGVEGDTTRPVHEGKCAWGKRWWRTRIIASRICVRQ